jgi:hypothetical protein
LRRFGLVTIYPIWAGFQEKKSSRSSMSFLI